MSAFMMPLMTAFISIAALLDQPMVSLIVALLVMGTLWLYLMIEGLKKQLI